MWIPTYHVFPSRVAFLAVCDAAGWPRGPDGKPIPPDGATLQEIGPIVGAPTVGSDGAPIPGEVLDARYHVNAAWHGTEPPEVFRAGAVAPKTPTRSFALPSAQPPVEPPVPSVIPAWKAKAALREAGLIGTAEVAVHVAGGRIRDAWEGASEWERASQHLAATAKTLGLTADQIDKLFRDADAIQG